MMTNYPVISLLSMRSQEATNGLPKKNDGPQGVGDTLFEILYECLRGFIANLSYHKTIFLPRCFLNYN
jgi:hypothetical protein